MSEFEQLAKQYENDNNLLIKLDQMEESIQMADKITKEYDSLKKEIKKQMVELGRKNNLEQIKWVTPKGIKITLSLGKEEIMEKQMITVFNEEILKEKYPKIYEECCEQKEKLVTISNGSNDRLVVTMPKGDN